MVRSIRDQWRAASRDLVEPMGAFEEASVRRGKGVSGQMLDVEGEETRKDEGPGPRLESVTEELESLIEYAEDARTLSNQPLRHLSQEPG